MEVLSKYTGILISYYIVEMVVAFKAAFICNKTTLLKVAKPQAATLIS
jgi:hypothetical protein